MSETVEVVIRIPKRSYESIISYKGKCLGLCDNAVKVGTVLTKGHGRLIDADAILEDPFGNTYKDIDIAETILEADREVDND